MSAAPDDPVVAAVYETVAAALAEHDKATAVRTAVAAVTSGAVSVPVLYRDVLARILADTGAAWQPRSGRPSGRNTWQAPPCAPSSRSCTRGS